MRRLVEDPEDSLGNVLRLDRLGAGVGGVILRLIASEAHQREFTLAQAWLDVAHPHARATQVAAQAQRELADERLGAAIHVGARVRVVARDRTDVEDRRPTAVGDQPWQQQAGGVHQALDVGVDHGFPVVQAAVLRGIDAQRQACVVDQATQLVETRRQVGEGVFHGLAVTHVEHQAVNLGLGRQLGAQGVQTLLAAAGENQLPASLGETPGSGFAETGSRASDENGGRHAVFLAVGCHRQGLQHAFRQRRQQAIVAADQKMIIPGKRPP
ncbi:hypothetical protein D3C81_1043880 [compost metagenome]